MDTTRLPDNEGLTHLVLQALVRKLVEKDLLSQAEVEALLLDAAEGIDAVGDDLTPQAARDIVREQLLPAFLRRPG
ncbi:MAG TPA: hypothetical protein DDZ67_00305 [Xanthomonadaceae bacterium]|nr:hypothetical protein [Xanthomonadaceae bacterium]